ncbi:MarR family transcriptional regulator protein (plasmid) [Rhizobium etli bv. phaseoli str. IE4803]|uniref:MarR family transcriptional regulator protein n=1 Tax=Rhizobium etli bv. mimosae str. IE4771 TaxID=1432050 RepID=A0A060IJU1_RHIET|nr:MarR family transcriptional regulator protein [Rhizobium sp. IE4771]AJC83800.1 MarR family transcriptional regulator protein [Rhizobium etli bv. phaseoli str. IE4803]
MHLFEIGNSARMDRLLRTKRQRRMTVKKIPPPLRQEDYEALADLRFALRQFMDFSASAAQSEGLPVQQHQALLAIKGQRGGEAMTIGMLAERLIIAPHTATELVGRLSDAGLVERHADPTDRRRQTILLTEKADKLLMRLSAVHLSEIRVMAPKLIELLLELQKTAK